MINNLNDNQYHAINSKCVCFNLRKVTRAVTQFYDKQLNSAGIRATQFSLLAGLASSFPKTLTEMAKGLGMDRTTLTRNLAPLGRMGFIVAIPATDKRSKAYKVTTKGLEVLGKAMPGWQKAQDRVIDQLGPVRCQHIMLELEALEASALNKLNRGK